MPAYSVRKLFMGLASAAFTDSKLTVTAFGTLRHLAHNPKGPGSHSVLKLLTGFAIAALTAWKLMVITAINRAMIPANPNIHHAMLIL